MKDTIPVYTQLGNDLGIHILESMKAATPQAPITWQILLEALQAKLRRTVPAAEIDAVLDRLHQGREINTATVTRRGEQQRVFWPTGITFLAGSFNGRLASSQHNAQENPNMKGSNADRMLSIIASEGPIIGAELAKRAGTVAKNIDGSLAASLKAGKVVTRKAYLEDHGRVIKHYMTPEQAKSWPAAVRPQVTEPADPAEATPVDDHAARDRETLLKMIGADSLQHAAEILTTQAQAASNFLKLLDRLQASDLRQAFQIIDGVDRFSATVSAEATPASDDKKRLLLLVSNSGVAKIDDLNGDGDHHARAIAAVENGEACRAILVVALGEARRTVEWKGSVA